ncbi:MAG: hypothetical protein COA66_06120 [Arcobacter sp.]|nr:MAG: hypothetical protein COA66_06120 [Arcobacter sp.]
MSLLLIIIFYLLYSLVFKHERVFLEPNIEVLLKEKANKVYLEDKIILALKEENIDDINMYHQLAKKLNIDFDNTLILSINEKNTLLNTSIRNIKEFSKGFIKGDVESFVSFTGSISSDFLLVGDIRDLYIEGKAYKKDEEYDEFILSISALGLFFSFTDIFSAGASIPLKISTSVLKVAKKTGSLTKPFTKEISKILKKSMNIKLLKKADFSSLTAMKTSYKSFSKSINLKSSKALLNQLTTLKQNTSYADSIFLLKYVDKTKDLNSVIKVSNKYKNNTKAVFKVLGKGAIKSTKSIIKITTIFILELVSLLFSCISFFSLVFFKSIFKKLIF